MIKRVLTVLLAVLFVIPAIACGKAPEAPETETETGTPATETATDQEEYAEIDEYVTLDMGCVGLDLAGNEYAVSICAKDNFSPYDYELTTRLMELAKAHGLPYAVDIYPTYSSDVSAALKAGRDIKGALIGPGVAASHGMERTHRKGIEATLKLLYLYLCGEDGHA